MTRRRRGKPKPYQKRGRWYGNFRSYRDVGGRLEALVPDGGDSATKDETETYTLFAQRLQYYKDRRAGKIVDPEPKVMPTLREYEDRHVSVKEDFRASSEERERRAFKQIRQFPKARNGNIRLDEITVEWCYDLRVWSRSRPGRKGKPLSKRTRQLEETALSGLLDLAVREGWIQANPMRGLKRIKAKRPKVEWLEPKESVKLLDAAREMDGKPHHYAVPYIETLLATFLLTGGRKGEVFGLVVGDIDFDNQCVHFSPNRYRRFKTDTSERDVPLWDELAALLVLHVANRNQAELLFRNREGGELQDLRGSLGRALTSAKITKNVTWHTFRHTYTSMRLQTLDNGEPISTYTVARELGHTDTKMIERVYGHLLKDRKRLPEVRYRPLELEPAASRV